MFESIKARFKIEEGPIRPSDMLRDNTDRIPFIDARNNMYDTVNDHLNRLYEEIVNDPTNRCTYNDLFSSLEEPKESALPIYIITAYDENQETILYVGMTTKQTNQKRFSRHSSLTKILADYQDRSEAINIYLCSIGIHYTSVPLVNKNDIYIDDEMVQLCPVEYFPICFWGSREDPYIERFVLDIESILIKFFQPKYNTKIGSISQNWTLWIPDEDCVLEVFPNENEDVEVYTV